MALRKDIERGTTGHMDGYWRITHYGIDRNAAVMQMIVHGYKDAEARAAGKTSDRVLDGEPLYIRAITPAARADGRTEGRDKDGAYWIDSLLDQVTMDGLYVYLLAHHPALMGAADC